MGVLILGVMVGLPLYPPLPFVRPFDIFCLVYIDMNNPEDNDYGKISIHLDNTYYSTFAR